MTILVCDDDKEIVEAIEIYLMQEGYDVEKAYDGIQAVEIMKNKKNRPHDNRCHDAKARRNKSYSADTKGKQGADNHFIGKDRGC